MDSNPADLICHYLDLVGVQSGANGQAEGVDSVPDGQGAVDGASRAVRCREESATAPILRVDVRFWRSWNGRRLVVGRTVAG